MSVGPIQVAADRDGYPAPAAPIRGTHIGRSRSAGVVVVFCDDEHGGGHRNVYISAKLWPDLKRKVDEMLAIVVAHGGTDAIAPE
jgi:hypothetical protein